MRIDNIPFGTTDWTTVESTTHKGDAGVATQRVRQFGDIRVRLVDYSPGYVADFLATSDGLSLTKAFMRIKSSKLRRRIVDLVEQIAGID